MKRVVFVVVLMLGLQVQAQDTILRLGDRLPNLYYWDTNWIDSKVAMHPESIDWCPYTYGALFGASGDMYIGRPCITSSPMKVIGIAGAVDASIIYNNDANNLVMDTDLSHRTPEYFRLYQQERDSLYFLREVRWDTLSPQYQMTYPDFSHHYQIDSISFDTSFDFYLTYFDVPVIVHDTFVVGSTTSNNYRYGYDSVEFPDNPWQYWYYTVTTPSRIGYAFRPYDKYLENPPYYIRKYNSLYYTLHPSPEQMLHPLDTSFQRIYTYSREVWVPFFAIFDTDFVYEACVGVATTGLQVEGMSPEGVTLAWDDSGVEQWQLSVTTPGVEADSGMLFDAPINYLQLSGLEVERWYVASVRTKCDSIFYGFWSDTVMFKIPKHFDTCDVPTWLHVTALDSATVTLAWDASDAMAWEVELGMVDLGMMGGQTTTLLTNSLQKNGLYTDAWYWARVRALCDTDFWSEWTDTICFHVPVHHVGRVVTPVEQYTYLMPNPAKEEVTVASSFRVKAVELYGSDGKLLQHKEVNAVGTTLDLKGLPAGLYFVRVVTTAGVTTKRLVVE